MNLLFADTFDNISVEFLDLNADAIASAVLDYAMSTETIAVPGGAPRTVPPEKIDRWGDDAVR